MRTFRLENTLCMHSCDNNTLADDGWAVTVYTVERGLCGLTPLPFPI